MTGKLHQSLRREEPHNSKLGEFIPIILAVVIIFVISGWVKVYMARRRRKSREASKRPDEAGEALPAYSSAGNWTQYSSGSGTGHTWVAQPRFPEPSMHPISAFDQSRGEHVILREMAALPTDLPVHSTIEDGGTHAENPQRLQRPFYSLRTDSPQAPSLVNHMPYQSSSSITLANSHIPTGSRGGPRAETAHNRNLANSNLPREVPPPYSEMVDQSSRPR